MLQVYEFAIRLMVFGLKIAALVHPKAALWVNGRKHWREKLQTTKSHRQKVFWLHAASLGEFEQGRPVIEAFRKQYPDWKIVLSFFSPSGFEVRKQYPQADLICYLPADTRRNARDFIDLIQPDLAVFVKYEFWANYLFELKKRQIPVVLVSALFRPGQPFFRWYGGFWRKMLDSYSHIFVQDQASGALLQSIGIQKLSIAGDTRVDQVLRIAEQSVEDELVERFSRGAKVLVAGSSWEPDETLIFRALAQTDPTWKLVIAPHEPSEANVRRISAQVPNALKYSEGVKSGRDPSVLIIDNIGLLNKLYRYGTVAYIGGGFGKGIHNTLEPAAFGLPVIFGPKYEKFEEARQFVARGGAFSVRNAEELAAILAKLQEPGFYRNASEALGRYLGENRGATAAIMAFLEQKFKQKQ